MIYKIVEAVMACSTSMMNPHHPVTRVCGKMENTPDPENMFGKMGNFLTVHFKMDLQKVVNFFIFPYLTFEFGFGLC